MILLFDSVEHDLCYGGLVVSGVEDETVVEQLNIIKYGFFQRNIFDWSIAKLLFSIPDDWEVQILPTGKVFV